MSNIISAAPTMHLTGIKDSSTRAPVREPLAVPTHTPLALLLTAWGPETLQLVGGQSANSIFGAKSFDPRSKFYTHATALHAEVLAEGNPIMVKRLRPRDAGPKARVLISLDIVADQIQQYERNPDGSFRLGQDGNKIAIVGANAKIAGHRAKWVVNDWRAGQTVQAFGEVTQKVGTLVSEADAQSTVIPMFEGELNFFGAHGNNFGWRLTAPTTASGAPINDTLAAQVKSYLYRLAVVSRQDEASTVNVVETLNGEQALDFSFREGVVDPNSDTEISIDDTFMPAFQDIDTAGVSPLYGPFGRVKVYQDNLEQVLAMVGELEAPHGLLPALELDEDSEFLHMVNLVGATSIHGVPYYSFSLEGPAQGGTRFSDSTSIWAEGGSDGTCTFEEHDDLAQEFLSGFGVNEPELADMSRYPFSFFYDSGFTFDTKMACGTLLSYRKNVIVNVATQDVSQPLNSPTVESSMSVSIKNALRLHPESEIHGTGVCRAAVIGHAGEYIGSKYKGPNGSKILPFMIEFARKNARYMGASTGIWDSEAAPDMPPNNQVDRFKRHNVGYKGANSRLNDWRTGLVWAQSYDMRSIFWPAIQTVYDDDTSVLNSYYNACIAADLEMVAQTVYNDLVGISGKMTRAQFIQRSDELIMERVLGRYDGRVTIRPETYFTVFDEQRGYSWRTVIHMYGENMRTVGTYTVEAHRSADLEIFA